jgi:hypothetical protein
MTLRVLAAIPHYYCPKPGTKQYGSLTQTPHLRAAALRACLAGLHESFGKSQCVLELRQPRALAVNEATACELHVVVCTRADCHLLADVGIGDGYFEHRQCDVEPMMLGFECHDALLERLDGYDFYCYLEDDLVIDDPWFFHKLDAFRQAVGDEKLLLPNRYERTRTFPLIKAYVDGPVDPRYLESLRQPRANRQEIVHYFDVPIVLRRPSNPHSGCFFLNQSQMAKWAMKSYFLDRDTSFVSPLESAATLGVTRTFAVYKPAPRVANFLEIEHFGRRWIEKLVGRATSMTPAGTNDG